MAVKTVVEQDENTEGTEGEGTEEEVPAAPAPKKKPSPATQANRDDRVIVVQTAEASLQTQIDTLSKKIKKGEVAKASESTMHAVLEQLENIGGMLTQKTVEKQDDPLGWMFEPDPGDAPPTPVEKKQGKA